MTTAIFTNDWITQIALSMYRGKTPPANTKFYVGLANTATLTRANTIADFVSAELLPNNGYARANTPFSGDGSYNTTTLRHEMPFLSAAFTASGSSFQFQTAFLMAGASAVASKSFTNSNVNATTDRITITGHGYISGDTLVFTADSLSTLPTGISSGTLYQVINPTTNDFQIALSGSTTVVDIQNTGSGTFRARNANGSIVALAVESSPITVPAGQGYTYQIPIVVLNTGYTNGI